MCMCGVKEEGGGEEESVHELFDCKQIVGPRCRYFA